MDAIIGRCEDCKYEALIMKPKTDKCSKCGGLVEIIAREIK